MLDLSLGELIARHDIWIISVRICFNLLCWLRSLCHSLNALCLWCHIKMIEWGNMKYENYEPRIGNGLVWTVSVDAGNILCDAVGDISIGILLVKVFAFAVASDADVQWIRNVCFTSSKLNMNVIECRVRAATTIQLQTCRHTHTQRETRVHRVHSTQTLNDVMFRTRYCRRTFLVHYTQYIVWQCQWLVTRTLRSSRTYTRFVSYEI